ncbi:MAG TPA: choice-of-anchor tandem repeat GloVer-containing protein [Verrucomicrobiae bacterium]|nr:choice-of-anchor tandem repeat GloVer-containing protein [Verrucomicrobiae bacterium]
MKANSRRGTKSPALAAWLTTLLIATSAQAQGSFQSLVSFTFTNGPDYGAFTVGSRAGALVQGPDGDLYGTTPTGGVLDSVPGYYGTVFKIAPDGAFTSLYLFGTVFYGAGGNDNGHWPQGNLIKGLDGLVYGTTQYGGPPNGGTVFAITTNGQLNVFYTFGNAAGYDTRNGWTNYDGASPIGGVIQASDGNFYGTTPVYGAYGNGTVFQLSPGGTLTTLHAFSPLDSANSYENADGANPYGELVEGPDGAFYGTTTAGGSNAYGEGTVFRVSADGQFATLHSFPYNAGRPLGGLVQGQDGNLYGTTSSGSGSVFQLNTNGTFSTLHTFAGPEGSNPMAALTVGSDGNFYGTTEVGGPTGDGTVFQITPGGALTTLHGFNGTDGANPNAALMQIANGDFYGTTSRGGAGYGTVFRLTIPPVIETITAAGGQVQLGWHAMPNQTCQVQYTTNLSLAAWQDLGSPITATNTSLSAVDRPAGDAQRFYRIQLR